MIHIPASPLPPQKILHECVSLEESSCKGVSEGSV